MKKSRFLISAFLLLLIVVIISNPARYCKSAADGILVFAVNVIPSLFPFLFLTKALTELGTIHTLSGKLKLTGKLFGVAPSGSYILLMSLLCGYPIGAKLISEYRQKGYFSQTDCRRAASFCSTSGPLFVLGTVGSSMLLSVTAGAVILTAHILGAVLNGLLFRRCGKSEQSPPLRVLTDKSPSSGNLLYESVYSSVISLFIVGGFITLFYVFIDILNDFHIIEILAYLPAKLLSLTDISVHISEALVQGMFETTRGCLEISRLALPLSVAAPCCCFAVSFGGMSIIAQSMAYLSDCKVPFPLFLLQKTTQAGLSTAVCIGLSMLLL